MPGHYPPLDRDSLIKLRKLVDELQAHNGVGVQMPKLVELAGAFQADAGLTIDLDAAAEIGQPLVVVRAAHHAERPAWVDRLSPREQEVAELVAAGLANKQIASRLYISVATVKDHVHHILAKAELSNRSALAAQWPTPESEDTGQPSEAG
ncbi:MAG: helix-turn-helix transcriptional regulator [Planctomycetota bacterium]